MVKPRIDITSKGHFAIWESGRWNPSAKSGFAIVVGGPNGEMLKSFYDKDPTRYNHHFLFPANLDTLFAAASLAETPKGTSYTLELRRITQLKKGAKNMAECSTELVWALHGRTKDNDPDLEFPPNLTEPMRNMIIAAWNKARTPHTEQKLFWGHRRDITKPPRVKALTHDEFGEPNFNR